MNHERFDTLARSLGNATSRRQMLQVLTGSALGGLGVLVSRQSRTLAGTQTAGTGGNAACAAFCAQVLAGSAAGHCTADAAHHQGLCYQCGPAAPAGHPPICGTQCCQAGETCQSGVCVATCTVEGAMRCQGTGFVTCDHGVEVFRDCAPGTVCRPFQGSILCDWPSS
jgi:hypothetical protein